MRMPIPSPTEIRGVFPTSDDAILWHDTKSASLRLWDACGVRRAPQMLEKLRAVRNDGPPYYVDEQTGDVSYRDDELIAWGNSLKHGPHHSTAEYKPFRPAGPGRRPRVTPPPIESPKPEPARRTRKAKTTRAKSVEAAE
jgi:hypothetical protein